MNIKRLLGIDTLAERYAYADAPEIGYTSTQRSPDSWVSTS